MAKIVRDANLETRTARARLKPSGKPYYRSIDEGLHLGYRKGLTSGKWLMRRYTGAGKYEMEPLGTADDTIDADGSAILSFGQAQAIARGKFVEVRRVALGLPANNGPYTVRLCIEEYLTWLDENRKTGQDARIQATALILPKLGDIECAKLSTKALRDWRDATAKVAARLRTKKGEIQRYRDVEPDDVDAIRRRRATTNRVLTTLKAALNHAWREQKIASDQAWRALAPFGKADAAKVRYLEVGECRRLINSAEPVFRNMVRAALLTGCRYGELCALDVGDFNSKAGTIHVLQSKSGKARHVVLTGEGKEFFADLAKARKAKDVLILRTKATRWGKSQQSIPMAEACKRAEIDPPASIHVLRHTYASLAVMNGAPLMVVARNLGHADTRMTEKHYSHLSQSFMADAIRAAAPRFGAVEESNDGVPN